MERAVAKVKPGRESKPSAVRGTTIRVTVDVRKSELELLQTTNEASGELAPLARFTVRKLWVAFRSMANGEMALELSVPFLEGADLRPGLPDQHRQSAFLLFIPQSSQDSLVICSTHCMLVVGLLTPLFACTVPCSYPRLLCKLQISALQIKRCFRMRIGLQPYHLARRLIIAAAAAGDETSADSDVEDDINSYKSCASFLTMEFRNNPVLASQRLKIRLQRPTVTAEVSFMLSVTKFFVPDFALNGAKPISFQSLDLRLGPETYKAEEDLWLCPETRLLADSVDAKVFTYDGQVAELMIRYQNAPTLP